MYAGSKARFFSLITVVAVETRCVTIFIFTPDAPPDATRAIEQGLR